MRNSSPKIFLEMFFTLILFTTNLSYGMFNEQGQWICSKESDVEEDTMNHILIDSKVP